MKTRMLFLLFFCPHCSFAEETAELIVKFETPREIAAYKGRKISIVTVRSWRQSYEDLTVTKVGEGKLQGQMPDHSMRHFLFKDILYLSLENDGDSKHISSLQFALLKNLHNKKITQVSSRKKPFLISKTRLLKLNEQDRFLTFEQLNGNKLVGFDDLISLRGILPTATPISQVKKKDELRDWKLQVIESMIQKASPNSVGGISSRDQRPLLFKSRAKRRSDFDVIDKNSDRFEDARIHILLGNLRDYDADLDKIITARAKQLKKEKELAVSEHLPFMQEELKRRKRVVETQIRVIRNRVDQARLIAELERYEQAETYLHQGQLEKHDKELYATLFKFAEKAAEGYVDQKKRSDRNRKR